MPYTTSAFCEKSEEILKLKCCHWCTFCQYPETLFTCGPLLVVLFFVLFCFLFVLFYHFCPAPTSCLCSVSRQFWLLPVSRPDFITQPTYTLLCLCLSVRSSRFMCSFSSRVHSVHVFIQFMFSLFVLTTSSACLWGFFLFPVCIVCLPVLWIICLSVFILVCC